MLLAVLCLAAMPGSDLQTTFKNAVGQDFWIEMIPHPEVDAKGAHGAVIVERPPAEVAALMRDIDNYKTLFAQVSDSKITQKVGKLVDAHVEAYIIMPGGITTVTLNAYIRHQDHIDDHGIWWVRQRSLSGRGSFKRYEVDARITPMDQGKKSLLEFWVMIVPDIPFVPDSIIEDENKKFARRALRALRLKATGVAYNPNDL